MPFVKKTHTLCKNKLKCPWWKYNIITSWKPNGTVLSFCSQKSHAPSYFFSFLLLFSWNALIFTELFSENAATVIKEIMEQWLKEKKVKTFANFWVSKNLSEEKLKSRKNLGWLPPRRLSGIIYHDTIHMQQSFLCFCGL